MDRQEILTNMYRKALYGELMANEGRLNSENLADDTLVGIGDRNSLSAIPFLLQRATLCCINDNDDGVTSIEHSQYLTDTLNALHAIKAVNEKVKLPTLMIPDGALGVLTTPIIRQSFHEMEKAFSHALNPPPLTTSTLSLSLPPSSTATMLTSESIKEDSETSPNHPDTASNKQPPPFVTAGQMMGRLAPVPAKKPDNVVRKPVGLSKRVRSEPPSSKPMAIEEDPSETQSGDPNIDPRLKGIDPKLVATIQNEIISRVDAVNWDQIAGLEHAKNTIKEIVIWPMLRPDIFTGLRGPPKGLLLFGPPGTGKTMIGKCIASQAKATFFSISSSSLTSKWVGEGEKLVRALFACARALQPSVVFIDEIDSLLTQRTDGEFEASRRIKTEFLVQFDGASTSSSDRILIIGATNRPQELDEAARRRLVKRLYIPLPDTKARKEIIEILLRDQHHALKPEEIEEISISTDGYSGADVDNLCKEAALGPIRSIHNILEISADQVRPMTVDDFRSAMRQVRASVSTADLGAYLEWNNQFGSLPSSEFSTK